MSENTFNGALRRLGCAKDEMVGYGFRSAARSMLNKCGLFHPDMIEGQLAHASFPAICTALAIAFYPNQ